MGSGSVPATLSSAQVAQMRLWSLGLAPRGGDEQLRSPVGVVRHHLAMQAQDWRASRWAIGSRLDGAVDADVLRAYDDGSVVRSWPMRGTVHAVAAEDLGWMLELMGQRALSGVQRRWDVLGIDESMLERARDVAVERLRGGNRCTRQELKEALEQAGLDLGGQRTYHAVWYLSQTGTLVQGPTRDGVQELVLLDEWVQAPRRLPREEALAELGRRYLQARGPATVEDLEHWTRLTKRDCRLAFEANADHLVEFQRGSVRMYMLRERHEVYERAHRQRSGADTNGSGPPALPVLALAAFDEHLLGYRVRDDVLEPRLAALVDPGRNGVFRWTIVSEGRVIGTWKRTPRTRYVRVEVAPFGRLPRSLHKPVSAAVERWGAFAGTAVETVLEER